jgi:hypothetical protein
MMRWRDYVLAYDDEVRRLVSEASGGSRAATVVLGEGFDPRALVGLHELATVGLGPGTRIVAIELASGASDQRAVTQAAENTDELEGLCKAAGWSLARLPFPTTSSRRSAGQLLSRRLLGGDYVQPDGLVMVDVSAMPASIAFPIIAGVLASHEGGAFRGQMLALVCENPHTDGAIEEEGASDAGPLAGLTFGLNRTTGTVIRAWAPALGERQVAQLESVYAFLEPNEITPILPFPAENARRADDLLSELRAFLFDRIEVEPSNLIYAHESNPFDVYRALWRLSERFQAALEPLGRTMIVVSVHGSKMLSLGVLLAAWERKLPVVTSVPSGYLIREGVELSEFSGSNRLACLWLLGEPYE